MVLFNYHCIEMVILSAYEIALPSKFRAARPMIWINALFDRKKHSLSASNIENNDISGISNPPGNRLIPINTSNIPKRREHKN